MDAMAENGSSDNHPQKAFGKQQISRRHEQNSYVGILFMAATYLLLSKSLLRVIIGTAVLSHGVHLLLLTMGGLKKGAPPILNEESTTYVDR